MLTARAVVVAATLTALLACQAKMEVTWDDEADVAAVNAVREAEVAAVMSGDASMPYAADDIVIMPPASPRVDGIEAAREWAAAFMAAVTVQDVQYAETHVTVFGNLAVEDYAGSITVVEGESGPVTETMKGVHVYRKGADGTWKMTLDIWNGDAPMMDEGM
jgi:ketosteroid isomerase-like protein